MVTLSKNEFYYIELVDYGIRNADVISVLLEICIVFVFGLLNCDLGEVVLCDEDSGKEFILCEYNRDADSYRSPWSNKFHPHLEDGMYPSEELRKLEVEANEVFTIYRDQYYEGGISSVYLWEEDDNEGFVACFLIKKDGSKYAHGKRGYLHEGGWEAIHVIQVGPDEEGMAHYYWAETQTGSPWSNKFHPHLEDGMYPSEELRKLEVEANEVFTIYRDQYYEGGISSVYLWEEDDNEGFVACFLIKKDGSKYAHGKRGYLHEGGWEAIHVIQFIYKQETASKSRQARDGKQESSSKIRQARVDKKETGGKQETAIDEKAENTVKECTNWKDKKKDKEQEALLISEDTAFVITGENVGPKPKPGNHNPLDNPLDKPQDQNGGYKGS
ncbi:probable F-actin-capping protein subunit beta [Tanacetum coccineum]